MDKLKPFTYKKKKYMNKVLGYTQLAVMLAYELYGRPSSKWFIFRDTKALVKSVLGRVLDGDLITNLALHKERRTWLLKYLTLQSPGDYLSKIPKGIGITPFDTKFLKEVRKDPTQLKLWMTLMYSTRAIKLPVKPNVGSIIQGPPESRWTEDDSIHLSDFFKTLGRKKLPHVPRYLTKGIHHYLSLRSGPNTKGKNDVAILRWQEDWNSLGPRVRDSVIALLQSSQLGEKIGLYDCNDLPSGNECRVASFSDLEGKTRDIGVGNYWIQVVLRPLHRYLLKIISKIPQDCTFDQYKGLDLALKGNTFMGCLDFKDATNLTPLDLQIEVLKGILPDEYCEHVRVLLSESEFFVPGVGKVRYGTGTPMGVYGSWVLFTLTHHFLWYRSRGIKRFDKLKYRVLGDDSISYDKELYDTYRTVVSRFSIPFQEAKCMEGNKLCEFAKRFVYMGQDVSPIPINSLIASQHNPYSLVPLFHLEHLRGMGGKIDPPGIFKIYVKLSRKLGYIPNRPKQFFERMYKRSVLSWMIIQLKNGKVTPRQALNSACSAVNPPLWDIYEIYAGYGDPYSPPWGSAAVSIFETLFAVFMVKAGLRYVDKVSEISYDKLTAWYDHRVSNGFILSPRPSPKPIETTAVDHKGSTRVMTRQSLNQLRNIQAVWHTHPFSREDWNPVVGAIDAIISKVEKVIWDVHTASADWGYPRFQAGTILTDTPPARTSAFWWRAMEATFPDHVLGEGRGPTLRSRTEQDLCSRLYTGLQSLHVGDSKPQGFKPTHTFYKWADFNLVDFGRHVAGMRST